MTIVVIAGLGYVGLPIASRPARYVRDCRQPAAGMSVETL